MSAPFLDPADNGGAWICESGDGVSGIAAAHPNNAKVIVVGLRNATGHEMSSFLTSETARKLAATLLELADRADGETVLAFMPDCPTCTATYPPGHPSAR